MIEIFSSRQRLCGLIQWLSLLSQDCSEVNLFPAFRKLVPVSPLASPLPCGPQSPTFYPQRGFDQLLKKSLPGCGREDNSGWGNRGGGLCLVWILGDTFSPGGSRADSPKTLGVKGLCPQWDPGEELCSGLGWPVMKTQLGEGAGEEFGCAGPAGWHL